MIDTINLHLSAELLPKNYQKNNKHLFTDLETITNQYGIKDTARYQNFYVVFNESGLYIYGSLAKYFLGTNQKTLQRSDITDAIDKLSLELRLPLIKAKVNRVDLAENIITEHPVIMYYHLLGDIRYFQRTELNKNVAYRNGNRYILFYDKVQEIKRVKETPSVIFNKKNALRIEYRFLKHKVLSHHLGLANVTVEDVILHYDDLVKAWYVIINNIEKYRNKIQFKPSILIERGLFDTQIKMLGIEAMGGLKAIKEIIDTGRQLKIFKHSNQASNILNKYKTLMANPKLTIKSSLINELEKKIGIAYFVHSRSAQHYI